MKFFFDENISHLIVKALACLEYGHKPDFPGKNELLHVYDLYDPPQRPVADTTWIPAAAEAGFYIITVDHAQKKNRGAAGAKPGQLFDLNERGDPRLRD